MNQRFSDRSQAGRILGSRLARYSGEDLVTVLGLPRGGVPVADEVAKKLNAPLDVFVVRKLGVPGHTELAMGAIASGGIRVLNESVVRALNISPETIDAIARREERELQRRELAYRRQAPSFHVEGRTIILVDDGMATGSSMRAAVEAICVARPQRIVVAVPVAPALVCHELAQLADEVAVCVTSHDFSPLGNGTNGFHKSPMER